MVNLWISISLLGLTGWQGYRLGREYGWWGRTKASAPADKNEETSSNSAEKASEVIAGGLGHSKTDFDRLLSGFAPIPITAAVNDQPPTNPDITIQENDLSDDVPITEPGTTLMEITETEMADEYPEETDQVPDTCSWMDDEDEPIEEEVTQEEQVEERVVALDEYVKRVKIVQRKMNQLAQKRQTDSIFLRQELGVLIQTYQLENDHSLDWLFQQHGQTLATDYGSLFDRIEQIAN